MLDKLSQVENRYEELQARSEQPDFYADPKAAARSMKEQRELEPVVKTFRAYKAARQAMDEALELMELEPEMKDFCQEEYQTAKKQSEALSEELRVLLLPRDPNDEKNVIVEIRGGVGGEESALFAHSLFRMYSMYAAAKGWRLELLNYNETELGGVKEADFIIEGDGAFSRMKFESGVHRVQRVPETESGGRIHTSTATVAVLPEMEAVDVEIRPEDIEMQVYRSSGAGGQHINKTSSAVRLIHKPTERERQDAQLSGTRKSQVGSGMRNEKIRTYNFPQDRVTDHRIGLTLHNIQGFMDGDLDPMIDALTTAAQAERLREGEG